MAVAHITTSGATATSASSVSVDVDTTTADYVNAFACWRDSDSQTISSLTREGAGMTTVGTDSSGSRIGIGCRRSSGSGVAADTFALTLSASTTALRVIVTAMSGVDGSTPVASVDVNTNLAGGASLATDATTVNAGNFALSCIVLRDNVSATLVDDGGADTTNRDAVASDGGGEITTFCLSFETTKTVTYSWTEPGSGNWARVQTVVYAASAGGGGVVGPLLAGHLTGRGILGGRLVH